MSKKTKSKKKMPKIKPLKYGKFMSKDEQTKAVLQARNSQNFSDFLTVFRKGDLGGKLGKAYLRAQAACGNLMQTLDTQLSRMDNRAGSANIRVD